MNRNLVSIGCALPLLALAMGCGYSVWTFGRWLDSSHAFRPARPEEVPNRVLQDGGMTATMANAIFRKTGSEEQAMAITAATRGPVRPDDLQMAMISRQKFVTEAMRYGFTTRESRDGFWMITAIYRPDGDGALLAQMNENDPL